MVVKVKNPIEIEFYDVKTKAKFVSKKYVVEQKGKRHFVVAPSPTGDYQCWKIIGAETLKILTKAGKK